MQPIKTTDQLPDCVWDGEGNVWWYSQSYEGWFFGELSTMVDWTEPGTYTEWTHWMPADQIPDLSENIPSFSECERKAAEMRKLYEFQ